MGRLAKDRKEIKRTSTRKFLGKLDGFTDKNDKVFNERMLRVYCKGKQYFFFGFEKEHLLADQFLNLIRYYRV